MPKKRDEWDNATHAFVEAAKKNISPSALKGLQTKWLNAKTSYWEAVRACWEEIQAKPDSDAAKIAEKHEVRLADLANIDIKEGPANAQTK